MPRHFQERSVARIEPTGPARSGRPDDRLRESRGRWSGSHADPGFRCAQPGLQTRKEAERRQTHARGLHRRMQRALSGARSPVGVPPRRLLRRANATAQLQIRASWDLVGRTIPMVRKIVRSQRALPAPSCPSPASVLADRSSCRPGVFSRSRPGAEVTSLHPREPLSLRQTGSSAGVPLREERDLGICVTEIETNVKPFSLNPVTAFTGRPNLPLRAKPRRSKRRRQKGMVQRLRASTFRPTCCCRQ